jgi:mono/diheme cytochrome c family protein
MRRSLILLTCLIGVAPKLADAADAAQIARGAYLFRAGGCQGCHTDTKDGSAPLAGGRAFHTPFGIFYGPNITPDPQHGIGKWSDADFIRALRQGKSPDGSHYFPVFPYTSFTGITDQDLIDLKAYIFSLAPAAQASKPHEVKPPFGWRWTLFGWKLLFFAEGPFKPDPAKSPQWNRGAYLVNALGHCQECHTDRNILGGLDRSRHLGGSAKGPEGKPVANISPHKETGIGDYSEKDIAFLLRTGLKTDGDVVGGAMGEVIQNSTSKLTDDDLAAMAVYLKSIAPVANQVGAPKPAGEKKKNAFD